MSDLVEVLRDIRGVYSDSARDRLPDGSVWEMTDWVPAVLQAGARMRGAWKYQSPVLGNPIDGMIFAPFLKGSKLLACHLDQVADVSLTTMASTAVPGVIAPTRQNPVYHRDRVIVPAADGGSFARRITYDGISPPAIVQLPDLAVGRYATVFKDRTVLGNTVAQPQRVTFSPGGDPTKPWDVLSVIDTSIAVTGLAAQRTQVLAFHDSSVERIRGTIPPNSDTEDKTGDMILDVLWDRAGCYDARSIAGYQDNVLFADARGIQLTDGAIVRNVTVQAGVMSLWHKSFGRPGPPDSISAVVHRDWYICTIRHPGLPPITFVVDIPTRRIFTLGNIDARSFAFSIATSEKLFGTDEKTQRVTDLTPVFDPDPTVLQVDADGAPVLPSLASGWTLLDKKPGFKRVIEAHFSYEAHRDDDNEVFQVSYINSPTAADKALTQLRTANKYTRRPVAVRRRMEGLAVRMQQLLPTKDSRLFDISVRTYPEEQSRT